MEALQRGVIELAEIVPALDAVCDDSPHRFVGLSERHTLLDQDFRD